MVEARDAGAAHDARREYATVAAHGEEDVGDPFLARALRLRGVGLWLEIARELLQRSRSFRYLQ